MDKQTALKMRTGQVVTFKKDCVYSGSYEITSDPLNRGINGVYFKIDDPATEKCQGTVYHCELFEEPHE